MPSFRIWGALNWGALKLSVLAIATSAALPAFNPWGWAQSPPTPSSFLEWLNNHPAENEPPRTTRGPRTDHKVCLVTFEAGNITPLWQEPPMFIFQGDARSLSLYREGRDTPFWTHPETTAEAVEYDGLPLRPGTVYTLRAENPLAPLADFDERQFRLISPSEQVEIALDLANLEANLQETGESEEAIALARADYLWQRGLTADAWAEVLPLQETSETISAAVKNAQARICP